MNGVGLALKEAAAARWIQEAPALTTKGAPNSHSETSDIKTRFRRRGFIYRSYYQMLLERSENIIPLFKWGVEDVEQCRLSVCAPTPAYSRHRHGLHVWLGRIGFHTDKRIHCVEGVNRWLLLRGTLSLLPIKSESAASVVGELPAVTGSPWQYVHKCQIRQNESPESFCLHL